jgi:2-polyprenyl-3-methyl-5-hydroxy-6-metoxy-1,4-benzoquinol methylase
MPVAEDLGKAYANYYTHTVRTGGKRLRLLKRVFKLMKRGYWAEKYQYPVAGSRFVNAIGKLLYLFPLRRREADWEVRFLHAVADGRLLDVGCGAGEWLLLMRGLGWRVEGIDFDERAVQVAAQRGLDVCCGTLEQRGFPSARFDAVILNHVIEHLPDPVATLLESARILKPGGRLVLFTPNSSSLGHNLFKGGWRGLEPPRHLHIFSMPSTYQILQQAGFQRISIRPVIARSVIYDSVLLSWGQSHFASARCRDCLAGAFARLFNILELCLLKWNPSVSDCLAAVAVK